MKRLTEKHYGANDYYMTCSEECERDNCVECAAFEQIVDRLGTYEDSGLTPEEINDLASVREISPETEYAINKHADSIIERLDKLLAQADDNARLRELARADSEGRVVVLPVVPVGRPGSSKLLYVIEDGEIYEDELCSATVGVGPSGGVDVLYETFSEQLCFYQTDIGKTVFLTREEAEEALRRAENG